MPGTYSKRRQSEDLSLTTFQDLENPWNFHGLFLQNTPLIIIWLRKNGLLLKTFRCPKCDKDCHSCLRSRNIDGLTFRCPVLRHEYSIRKFSFFERSHFDFADIFQFIKCFLDGLTLKKCARFSGLDYKRTAVDWANFVRDLFQQWVEDHYPTVSFTGEVEIDESLFGRKCKYHRGNSSVSIKVWIFGVIERASNRLLLFPVDQRNAETLIPIIQRHVTPGTRIYSDNWAAYRSLNDLGYEHFSVTHKVGFKKVYENVNNGDKVEVHTNRIEGAWKHAKQHFRKINGTSLSNFEAHLAEIVWRNFNAGSIYPSFFQLIQRYYNLQGPPNLHFPKPLFSTWSAGVTANPEETTIIRGDSSDQQSQSDSDNVVLEAPIRNSSNSDVEEPMPLASGTTNLTSDSESLPDLPSCAPKATSSPWLSQTLPSTVTVRKRTQRPRQRASPVVDVSSAEEDDPQPGTSVPTATYQKTAKKRKKAVHQKTAKGKGKGKGKNTAGRNFHPKTFIPLSVEEPRPGDRYNVPSQ